MLPYYAGVYAYDDTDLHPTSRSTTTEVHGDLEPGRPVAMGWQGGRSAKAVKTRTSPSRSGTGDDEMRANAIHWLKAHAKDANPFFMYLNFMKVHNPNYPSPRFKGKSPGGGTYLDSLMELDDNTGQVMQAIRDLGLAENTLVVWTTDNGAWIDAWPDAGYTPFRGDKGRLSRAASACRPSPGGPARSKPARSTLICVAHGLVADFRQARPG